MKEFLAGLLGFILGAIIFAHFASISDKSIAVVDNPGRHYVFKVGTGCPAAFPYAVGNPINPLPEHCWRYWEMKTYVHRMCRHCRYEEIMKITDRPVDWQQYAD